MDKRILIAEDDEDIIGLLKHLASANVIQYPSCFEG